ncbi:MAG: AAA family ATPase [Cyclobacteriaceae bacterium]
MILESVELVNFLCYSGDKNKFEFKEGINVIVGDNGYGKSKLYDAFYWVMYDKIFDTNAKSFRTTSQIKDQLVSDKAKNDTDHGPIQVSVKLTFHDTEKDEVYILERKYEIRKSDGGILSDDASELIISHKELSYMNARVVNDPHKIDIIKGKILPDNIKPYMWFQGEQVESIIDFNQNDTLTQAINVLSNISRYDNIITLADSLKESGIKELNRKKRDLSKDLTASEELEVRRKRIEEKIHAKQIQEVQIKDNQAKAEERSERLLNQLSDAKRIRELEQDRKNIEENLRRVREEHLEAQIAYHKKMFTNKWVLKSTEGIFDDYSKAYDGYEQTKLKKETERKANLMAADKLLKEMQTRLPIDVPEPIHMEKMLEIERCLVCDREAPEGSEPYQKMKEILERSKMRAQDMVEEDKPKNDFSMDLKKLYQNGLAMSHLIDGVDDDITRALEQLDKLDSRRRELQEEYDKLDSQVKAVIGETAINVNDANNLINEYSAQNDMAKNAIEQSSQLKYEIEKLESELALIEKDLTGLVVGELPVYLEEKVEVLNDFQAIAHSTRKRVFNRLVEMLESEANRHYQEMTSANLSAKGIIRLRELSNGKNYMPELVDEQGNVLRQLNTSNIILIKLATIMAIVSARQSSRDTDLYTLITDAPTSVFGEDYTIGFCRTVSKVYRQSIIMSKEFYKNEKLRKELLQDDEINLGNVWMITPSIPEAERTNRNSLTTHIQKLN